MNDTFTKLACLNVLYAEFKQKPNCIAGEARHENSSQVAMQVIIQSNVTIRREPWRYAISGYPF
jgi:hypothetical protein